MSWLPLKTNDLKITQRLCEIRIWLQYSLEMGGSSSPPRPSPTIPYVFSFASRIWLTSKMPRRSMQPYPIQYRSPGSDKLPEKSTRQIRFPFKTIPERSATQLRTSKFRETQSTSPRESSFFTGGRITFPKFWFHFAYISLYLNNIST